MIDHASANRTAGTGRRTAWKGLTVLAPAAAIVLATACAAPAAAPAPAVKARAAAAAAPASISPSPALAVPTAPAAAQPARAAAPAAAQEVTIVTGNGARFSPSALTVRAGQPVRLVLRNEGGAVHDFTLSAGAAGLTEEVNVVAAGGSTASVTFTPTAPGTYEFVCGQPGHEAAGMTGTLTVVAA
jgi:uncharacterized cupredoxin-like copper-binding protein